MPANVLVWDAIADMFASRGGSLYGGEAVTQEEHALQAAFLAHQQNAADSLVTAALLHDLGHLLHDLPEDAPDQGVDDAHEFLAAAWLEERFIPVYWFSLNWKIRDWELVSIDLLRWFRG